MDWQTVPRGRPLRLPRVLIETPIRGILRQSLPIRVTAMMRNLMHSDALGDLAP
jgi:hypothetical protein